MGLFDGLWGAAGGSSGFGSGDPSNTDASSASGGFGFSQAGVSGAVGLAGLGLDVFGSMGASSAAADSAKDSAAIFGLESQVNAQKQIAMQVSARRQQTQIIRTAQQQRAMGVAAAANQGALQGSGVQGAQAQNTQEGAYNLQGVSQNLEIGTNIFGLDNQISGFRQQQAMAQAQQAADQGISSIGGALMKAAPTIASFAMML